MFELIERAQFGDVYSTRNNQTTNEKTVPKDRQTTGNKIGVDKTLNTDYNFSILGFFILLIALLLITNKT